MGTYFSPKSNNCVSVCLIVMGMSSCTLAMYYCCHGWTNTLPNYSSCSIWDSAQCEHVHKYMAREHVVYIRHGTLCGMGGGVHVFFFFLNTHVNKHSKTSYLPIGLKKNK